ncbi:hypothetical protein [Halomicrococcus sp. NG-SE-24]|uniref:hypothetical protein n=1 Tax=Halomicrococcus sp. NG-SE-24 TaxID=3436928 RepID=UPI003D96EECD
MNDDEQAAEELLQQSGEQKRHNSEPSTEETTDARSLQDAIVDAYEAIDDGDSSSNITVRDENLAALVRGLEDVDELSDVAEAARDELDRDEGRVSRSQTLGDLARVGLDVVAPEVIEDGKAARKEFVLSQEDEF